MKPLSQRQKQLAYRLLVHGPLRFLAKPIFQASLAAQKRWYRSLLTPAPPLPPGKVTAIIKTFERQDRCTSLIESIRRAYPDLPIVVVDDSRTPGDYPGCKVLRLPFDSGLSAGRNAGLAAVKTDYTLLLDDDLLFETRTDLGGALAILENHPAIDLLSGIVLDLPLRIVHDFRTADIYPTGAEALIPQGTRIGPAEVMDKLPNFFLARTEALRKVGWDPELKLLEHADFFTRAKGVVVSAEWSGWRVLHCRDPFNRSYAAHRYSLAQPRARLALKYPGL